MINKKNIKKTVNFLAIFLIAISTNVMKAYCEYEGGGTHTETVNPSLGDGNFEETDGCGLYRSSVSINSDVNSSIKITAYDMEGNDILNSNGTISLEKAVKAGTWVGINITETYSGHYSYSVSSYEIRFKATCEYTCRKLEPCDKNGDGVADDQCQTTVWKTATKSGLNKCDKESFTCESIKPGDTCTSHTPMFSEYKVSAGGYKSSLENRIKNSMDSQIKSSISKNIGDVYYIPVNDYDDYKVEKLKVITSGIQSSSKDGKNGYKQSYTYFPNKICMNLKNGNISYYQNECREDEEKIEIKNGVAKDGKEYWHYFIPLNMKSSQIFSIGIEGDKVLRAGECEGFDNEHISPSDKIESLIPKSHLKKSKKGCTFNLGLEIPVIQRFYNEVDGTKFEGFNFYYRPIDINEPFPNGLTNTSIWYDWKKDLNKDPDISKSYNSTTYVAKVGNNTSAIRNYTTDDLIYTSWENINLKGESEFIDFLDRNHIGGRTEEYDKPYKLGCGDANKNQTNKDGSKNYMYVEWCGKS